MRWHPGTPRDHVSLGELLKAVVVFVGCTTAFVGIGYWTIAVFVPRLVKNALQLISVM